MIGRILALAAAALLAGCGPSNQELRGETAKLAASVGMRERVLHTGGSFDIYALERIRNPAAAIRIYIEGDGNAWLTRSQPSPDPTPLNPTALQLAMEDNATNVVYLGRPCQYVRSGACNRRIWTLAQFSEPAVASMNAALNQYAGHKLELVGYSGGGGMVMLLAARRNDVISLRTVAGNIDTQSFTNHHHVSALEGDNPAAYRAKTSMIPQIHFTGEKDKVVPPLLAAAYQASLPASNCSRVLVVPGADHATGWQEQWKSLVSQSPACK
ncbi:MAG: alpha/beta hydrolase [Proteobacteria bacterium]|nr:alpha/beta hydrolase [Pseudomonadota bacterium]